ncbi:hypothetical protein C0J52_25088 [Blattella germanica]|nr:hypothetical protein C0J52_25088 [Blattella germanica]
MKPTQSLPELHGMHKKKTGIFTKGALLMLIQISSKGEVESTSSMFTNEEYRDMHFVYGFCNGSAALAEDITTAAFPLSAGRTTTFVFSLRALRAWFSDTDKFRFGGTAFFKDLQTSLLISSDTSAGYLDEELRVTNRGQTLGEKVSLCFNALQDSGPRTAEQLKNAYDCIKRKARKDQSLDKTPVPLSWTPLQVGHICIEPQVSKLEGFYCIKCCLQFSIWLLEMFKMLSVGDQTLNGTMSSRCSYFGQFQWRSLHMRSPGRCDLQAKFLQYAWLTSINLIFHSYTQVKVHRCKIWRLNEPPSSNAMSLQIIIQESSYG